MLQTIREHAQGWLAWVIVVLISVPFALWGIQEYAKVGAQRPIATVNGYEIQEHQLSQQVQRTRVELRSRLGRAYRPELFDNAQLRNDVLERMIKDQLIIDRSIDMGLRVSDGQIQTAIAAIPAFQKDGKFDKNTYDNALATQGMTSAQLDELMRSSLITTQLRQVVTASEFTTKQELDNAVRLQQQKRSFQYFLLPNAKFESKDAIAKADLEQYYETHRDEFFYFFIYSCIFNAY